MSKRWHYFGDVRLTEGGFYWREDGADDYVCAVDVTPCSNAGGPSNLFHIEAGSIFLPVNDPDRLNAALDCCGWQLTESGNLLAGDGAEILHGTPTWRAFVVAACKAYHGIDRDTWNGSTVVQIGRDEGCFIREGWSPNPDVILRGNAKLANYVRRQFLD